MRKGTIDYEKEFGITMPKGKRSIREYRYKNYLAAGFSIHDSIILSAHTDRYNEEHNKHILHPDKRAVESVNKDMKKVLEESI